jgi:hypothetical protein
VSERDGAISIGIDADRRLVLGAEELFSLPMRRPTTGRWPKSAPAGR